MQDVRKTIRLSPELAAQIDVARGDVSWSRWVLRALEQALSAGVRGSVPEPVSSSGAVPARASALAASAGRVHLATCRCPVCSAK